MANVSRYTRCAGRASGSPWSSPMTNQPAGTVTMSALTDAAALVSGWGDEQATAPVAITTQPSKPRRVSPALREMVATMPFLLARSNDSALPGVFGHDDRPKALPGTGAPGSAFGQGTSWPLVRRQPVAEREERCLSVAAVDRLVGDGVRPAHGELAGVACAEEVVGDALALSARQPGRDERVRLRQLVADDHRSSRVEDRDALLHVLADVGELGGVVTAEGECRAVTLALGVWCLTAHPDADVAAVVALRVRADVLQGDVRAGRRLLQRLPERRAAGRRRPAAALPGDGPAAHLVAEVVRRLPAHDNLVRAGRRQRQCAVVLEQDLRFAHRLPRDRPVRGRADLRGVAAVGVRRTEQAQPELGVEDAGHGVVDPGLRDQATGDA